MTEASKAKPSVTVDMNMAGVEAMPRSVTCRPSAAIASMSHSASCGPDRRESRPTATRSVSLPSRARSHRAKPRPISRQACSVRFTCWPSMPSMATPRMSLPFCSFV